MYQRSLLRADRETALTHIKEARVIGSHAEMGGPPPVAALIPSTVVDTPRASVRRRIRRSEMDAAQSTWDSEGGATAPSVR